MRRLVRGFLLDHSFWAVELYSSFVKIIWGLLLLGGGIQSDRPPFLILGQVTPREYIWGVFFILIGGLHTRSLFFRRGREFQSILSVFVWTWVSIALLFSRGYAGFFVYGLLAVFCGLAALRLRLLKSAGVIDD